MFLREIKSIVMAVNVCCYVLTVESPMALW